MRSFFLLTSVLVLLALIGIGCAAQQGPGSNSIKKEPLSDNPGEMEKPHYDENRPLESIDDSKSGQGPMKAYEPGQVIVKFLPEMNEAKIGKILAQHHLSKIKALPLPGVYQVKILSNDTVEKVIETLSKETAVVYAEPNFIMQTQ